MARIDKENYYLDIAETVLERAICTMPFARPGPGNGTPGCLPA